MGTTLPKLKNRPTRAKIIESFKLSQTISGRSHTTFSLVGKVEIPPCHARLDPELSYVPFDTLSVPHTLSEFRNDRRQIHVHFTLSCIEVYKYTYTESPIFL